ncbi:STAS domain-containing protein [Planomicrobium sp. Y74]|uniref:STAS domain-containing protein n=1 Tax=Planomicrobium sp. Y74 TaxID=2478977 RepID=UPI000EF4493C|nr:STAS domain-containing protein [Planomicrobium sp. Y74]RLQ91384.1 STAS domain-containing protein [Planomicrobium sp. Y74]
MLTDLKLQDYFNDSNQGPAGELNEKSDNSNDGIIGTSVLELPEELGEPNTEFHLLFRSMITKEFEEFQRNFLEWMIRSPKDEEILSTPLPDALAELFHVQKEYLQLIEVFASLYRSHIPPEEVTAWNLEVTTAFNKLILQYTVQHSIAAQLKMVDQQKMCAELSAPLLLLTERTGLLPITGKITEYESQIITEKTLQKCCDAKLEKLYIDLSGIHLTERRDAQHLLLLFNGLKILSVKTVLTGIRPELAKIFIQSNFDSSNIEFSNTLAHALKTENLQ